MLHIPKDLKKTLKAFFFHHVFCNIILFSQTFSLTSRRKTIISCARWKTVISANEIQWIRALKRCSEQDNSVWLISDFDSEIFRKTSAPLFLQGEKAIRSPSLSSPLSDTAVLNNNYICRILRETFSLSSFSVTVHFTHFDGRFISISGMRAAMSVGVCRMFQHLDMVS